MKNFVFRKKDFFFERNTCSELISVIRIYLMNLFTTPSQFGQQLFLVNPSNTSTPRQFIPLPSFFSVFNFFFIDTLLLHDLKFSRQGFFRQKSAISLSSKTYLSLKINFKLSFTVFFVGELVKFEIHNHLSANSSWHDYENHISQVW